MSELLLRMLCWLAGRLSLASVRRVGGALGALAWTLRVRRRVAVSNIVAGLGLEPPAATRLARRVYRQLGWGAVEFLRVGQLTTAEARRLLGQAALERLQAVLSQGRGAIVLGAHQGNWDLLACAACRCGIPVNVVTRRLKQASLNRFWMRERERCGVRLLPAAGSALAIRAALRRNEVVAMVLDQHEPNGIVVPFLGRPAATTPAMARIARATGSPVLPAFLLRTPGGFRLELHDPVESRKTPDVKRDILKMTEDYSRVIEGVVRRHPTQWLWLHRRWKVDGPASPADGVAPR